VAEQGQDPHGGYRRPHHCHPGRRAHPHLPRRRAGFGHHRPHRFLRPGPGGGQLRAGGLPHHHPALPGL